jgi:hypothetical protein
MALVLAFPARFVPPAFPSGEGVHTAHSPDALRRPGRMTGLSCRWTSQPLQRKALRPCNPEPTTTADMPIQTNANSC